MEYITIPIYHNDKQANLYQNELMNFFIFLTKTHPAFILDKSLETKCRQTIMQMCEELHAMDNLTLADFQLKINELLVLLQDAHTFINIEPSSLYPFAIRYFNGCFYLYSISSHYRNVTGKAITSMGGIDMADIHKRMIELLPSENEIKAGIIGSHFLSNRSVIKRLGINSNALEIGFSDGDKIEILPGTETNAGTNHIANIKPNEITGRNPMPFHYRIVDSICYFQFNEMFDSYTYQMGCQLSGEPLNEELFHSLPSFLDFLEQMIEEINHRQEIQLLVVDMRYNGGGNSILGDILLKALNVDLSGIKGYHTYIRVSEFLKKHFASALDASVKTDEDSLIEQSRVMKVCKDIPSPKHTYTKKVVFIQGQNTFSSANYLLTTVKDNHLFPIVGTPTSQKPTCYGDIIPINLPFTNTKGFVSHSFFQRPDASRNADKTLEPDVKVNMSLESYLNGIDSCWNWIKESIPSSLIRTAKDTLQL